MFSFVFIRLSLRCLKRFIKVLLKVFQKKNGCFFYLNKRPAFERLLKNSGNMKGKFYGVSAPIFNQ